MKPRYRPGKAGTSGRAARAAIAQAKPLTPSQIQHLKQENADGSLSPRAGRGGKRAGWKIDYEEGVECDKLPMPCREPESFTVDGTRRWPKRGG